MKIWNKICKVKDKTVSDEYDQRKILDYSDESVKSEVNQSIIHTRQDLILLLGITLENYKLLRSIKYLLIIAIIIMIWKNL
tara:strand:- start:3833 stop:4075 length:243 start_codon:yes stop_codon:yes gene_type:complete